MPEKWTGRLIGRLHNEEITYDDVAKELGCSKAYISMILHGARKPEGIRERMEKAVSDILARRRNTK